MNSGEIKTFDFRDLCITEFDEAFKKFQSSNTPLSGLSRVSIRGICCPNFEILWRRNTLATIQENTLPANAWLIQLPYPDPGAIATFLQHPEGSSHSMLGCPQSELIWHVAAEMPLLTLAVSNNLMGSLFTGQELELLRQRERHHRNQLSAGQLQNIGNHLVRHLNPDDHTAAALSADKIKDEIRELVVQIGSILLTPQLNGTNRINNRERILTRSLDFIRQNYSREMRLIDIVNHAHTTTRNLQIVFKTHVGLTPLQYIKRYRLMQFHKGLRTYGTVTEAAVFSGLRHMGRLSDEYRKLFGENPGDYLTRYKGSGGVEYPPSSDNQI